MRAALKKEHNYRKIPATRSWVVKVGDMPNYIELSFFYNGIIVPIYTWVRIILGHKHPRPIGLQNLNLLKLQLIIT
jgi:hypothetical protein